MFIDLVGSTELGARLDPEDLRSVIGAYHQCATGLVVQAGGFVARYMGDGLLVYFGYPNANEADAERAVRAGLAVVKAIGLVTTIAGPPGTLSARIGIATGLTVVGDLIGSGSALEAAVVGGTPNLAARLQALAAPNTIVVSDTTRSLARRSFEYLDLGLLSLKGLAQPVRAWSVLREAISDCQFDALYLSQVPLVGREEELAQLVRRWKQAKEGEGRVVLLSGEPGIGKSRLIAALEEALTGEPYKLLRFSCSPHFQDTPLQPIARQIERGAGLQSNEAPATKLEKLRKLLGPKTTEADIALVAELLSITGDFNEPDASATPRQRKEAMFAAIARYIAGCALECPLLVALEDIHWADATTREFFDAQIEEIERLPILLVISTRPELQPSWVTNPQVTVQILGGLHRRQATSLIQKISRDRVLPDPVVERIIAHADGVPLFIEELTKTVLEKEVLDDDAGSSSPSNSLAAEIVPTSLQASLMARLDRASRSKEVAQIGSVIGREFSFETLIALSGASAKHLEDSLAQLVQLGLVTRRGELTDAVYSFKHALVQDAAYASLLRDRRRSLHREVAETLERKVPADASTAPQLIGWHFGEAGEPDKAIDHYLLAVEKATGRFALRDMLGNLRKALRQLGLLPDSASRQRRELDLQVRLGQVLIDLQGSGNDEVRTAFERARELSLALGDTKRLLVVFDGLVLNHYFTRSASRKMHDHADELLKISRGAKDDPRYLWALRMRGSASLLEGHLENARRTMQLVIDMYRDMRDASDDLQMARHPRVSTYANLGVCLTVLGYPVAGAAMAAEGIRHAEALSRPVSLTAGLRRACVRSMMQRDVQSVVNLSARISVLNAKHETFVGTHEGAIFREWAQLRTKRSGDALERVSLAIEKLDAANHWVMLPFFMTSIAEILGEHGDRDRAIALIERADQLATLTGERWSKAESMRVEARLKADEPAVAIELLQASIAVAREQGAKLWELRAAKDLAEMWHARGRSASACEVLLPVCDGVKEASKHRTLSPLESCSPVSSDFRERRLSA